MAALLPRPAAHRFPPKPPIRLQKPGPTLRSRIAPANGAYKFTASPPAKGFLGLGGGGPFFRIRRDSQAIPNTHLVMQLQLEFPRMLTYQPVRVAPPENYACP